VSLDVSRRGGVAWVRLNRPEQRNAIDRAMRAALAEAFSELDLDDEIRIVVLTGEGPAFCAGVDLKEAPPAGGPFDVQRVSHPLDRFGKPVLAAVNGAAFGGGLELVLAADLRIAADTATFALPEVKIGSLPGSGGTQRLPDGIAAKLLFTGDPIDAAEALRAGLVSDVVPAAELPGLAERIAGRVAENAPLSLRAAKLALRAAREQPAALTLERALWAFLSASSDRAEGRAAFREKRAPRFTGS
jgi:enoyl-CoA hydratase/carnithine racemase